MKYIVKLVSLLFATISLNTFGGELSPGLSHGIAYPTGWQNWSIIAVSHRNDNHTLRVILGNKIAVKAARSGKTKPWPEGAVIGKVVWKETNLKDWKSASAPDQLVHAEFMFKDSKKYSDSYNWGWARWVGLNQEPFNKGAQVCTSCHTPVKDRDWVFTNPAPLP